MKRTFVPIGSGLLVGMACISIADSTRQAIVTVACLVLFILTLFLPRKRVAVTVFCACVAIGALLFSAEELQYRQTITAGVGEQVVVGSVVDYDTTSTGNFSYTIAVDAYGCNVLLYGSEDVAVEIGDQFEATATLYLPESSTYDGTRYYKTERVYLLGWIYTDTITVTAADSLTFGQCIARLNERIASRLDQVLSTSAAATVKSMVLGDRSDLDDVRIEQYIASGSYHLFSVSGLHLSILVGALLYLTIPLLGRRWGGASILGVLFFFLVLSGFHLSTFRSFLMVSLLLIGRIVYQRTDSLNSLFFAITVILLWDCYAILDVGFLLSITATFGIIWVYPRLVARCPLYFEGTILAPVRKAVLFSMAVTLPMLPVYLWTFERLSLVTVLSNLFIVPLASVLLLLSFVLCLLVLWWAPSALVWMIELLVNLQNSLAQTFAQIPYAVVGLDYPALKVLVCVAVAVIFTALVQRGQYYRRALFYASVSLTCACAVLAFAYPLASNRLYLVGDGATANLVFVNQGHAVVICTNDDNYIDELTLDLLVSKGIQQIDHLIYTYDSWNYYEDTRMLLSNIEVEQVWMTAGNQTGQEYLAIQFSDLTVHEMTSNVVIEQGDLTVSLYPQEESVWTVAEYFDLPIRIGSPSFVMQESAVLYFLSGANSYTEVIAPEVTWLLKESYSALEIDLNYAYEGGIYFEFTEDQTVLMGTD